MAVVDSSMLIKVPAQLMPVRHLACSRSLCTAYRLLEDYGSLRPGDTIIQNAADLPVGQAVIQLCKMLKIRSINLVPDDEGFERTKELLVQLGATHVLRDNSKLAEFLEALGSEMPAGWPKNGSECQDRFCQTSIRIGVKTAALNDDP